MACDEKWLNPDSTLKDLFSSTAFSQLTEPAKALNLSQVLRLSYWGRPGDPPPKQDPVLNALTIEDMDSITKAMETHLKEKGRGPWQYKGMIGFCTACTWCAATLPPGTKQQRKVTF